MTREGIEKQMDNLARKYVETHDPEIIEALPVGPIGPRA
jgi:hypothetical protein